MKIGLFNQLTAKRSTDNGFYLIDEAEEEVLLPNAYVPEDFKIGDSIDVFVYKDSEDRIVATTEEPYIQLGEFAYLEAVEVNQFGAFMDWGLRKDLLVPYAHQRQKMKAKSFYPIYLKYDEQSERLVATSWVDDYLEYNDIQVKEGEEVEALLIGKSELGMNAIINGKYKGLIFNSFIHQNIASGDYVKCYVKKVREDGKIDLSLEPLGYRNNIDKGTSKILITLADHDGFLKLNDKSDPEDVKEQLGMSKKAFKRAIGKLYKEKSIEFTDGGIRLL